jgi:hypothetical protein
MTEPLDHGAEWDDVEALVRAAGGYVRPSEELRPRVLEAARAESSERWAQRRILQVALVVALWGGISTATGGRWEVTAPFSAGLLQVHAELRPAEGRAADWSMVESFTDLRRRQAALLSLTR